MMELERWNTLSPSYAVLINNLRRTEHSLSLTTSFQKRERDESVNTVVGKMS